MQHSFRHKLRLAPLVNAQLNLSHIFRKLSINESFPASMILLRLITLTQQDGKKSESIRTCWSLITTLLMIFGIPVLLSCCCCAEATSSFGRYKDAWLQKAYMLALRVLASVDGLTHVSMMPTLVVLPLHGSGSKCEAVFSRAALMAQAGPSHHVGGDRRQLPQSKKKSKVQLSALHQHNLISCRLTKARSRSQTHGRRKLLHLVMSDRWEHSFQLCSTLPRSEPNNRHCDRWVC